METQPNLVRQLAKDATAVLTEPTDFFKNRHPEMSFNQSLALGLSVTWLAAVLDWITRAIKKESLLTSFQRLKNQLQELPFWKDLPEDIWAQSAPGMNTHFPEWILEGMKVMLTPFQSVISFFFSASMFWLGAILLVSRSNPTRSAVTVKEIMKITAVAASASIVSSILGFLPFGMGSFVGWVYHIVLLTIGFSVRYEISRMRSVCLVFLPTVISIALLVGLVMFIFAFLAIIVSSLFHG